MQGGTVMVVVADPAAARSVNMRNHSRAPILTNMAGTLAFRRSLASAVHVGLHSPVHVRLHCSSYVIHDRTG